MSKVRNAIKKGRRFQKTVCEAFACAFSVNVPDDVRTAVGSETGSDVKMVSSRAKKTIGLSIECKNTVQLSIWKAIEQAKKNANKEKLAPCIVFKNPKGMRKPWIALPLEYYLKIEMEENGDE